MKIKLLITSLLLSIASLSLHAAISITQAEKMVKDYVEKNTGSGDIDIYKAPSLMTRIEISYEDAVVLTNPNWCFFVDQMPNAGWSHKCMVVCVSSVDGKMSIVNRTMPPIEWDLWENISKKESLRSISNGLISYDLYPKSGINNIHAYAVIIDGGYTKSTHGSEYWNNCSMIYQALVNVLGYQEDNIYVLMADGQNSNADLKISSNPDKYISSPLNLDGKGRTNDIRYAATNNNINIVFDELSKKMTNNDELFVFTTDHGGLNSSSAYLCLWNNEKLTPTQLNTQLNKLKTKAITIVMAQCHSGGFIETIKGNNRTICTACAKNEYSWAYSHMYGLFTHPFVSALAGYDAYGTKVYADANNDSQVSTEEAFAYALNKDSQANAMYIDSTWHETPQYWSYKTQLRTDIKLGTSCLSSDNTLEASNKIISANINYKSGNKILLKKGFSTKESKFKGTVASNYLRSINIDDSYFDEIEEIEYDDGTTDDENIISDENKNIHEISLYPNPTTGIFSVWFRDDNVGNDIVVTDISGKVILSMVNVGSEIEIDLSNKTKGVYFVKLTSNGKTIVKQVVLM